MKPDEFGTEKYPLRISSLPMLIKCPARIALGMLESSERTSNKAADTGTAAHHAIAAYHKGLTSDAAIADMRASVGNFPLADLDEAQEFVSRYVRDPRNTKEAVKEAEFQLSFTLPCHSSDPTGKAIYFKGTTDQIREAGENLYEVWDYKTGRDEGVVLLHEHLFQLAGYSYGVQTMTGGRVIDQGVIRARGYFNKHRIQPEEQPPGVFFHGCLDTLQIETLLYRVKATVAGIRRGEALFGPGPYCNHCPYEGTSVCIPKGLSLGLRCV